MPEKSPEALRDETFVVRGGLMEVLTLRIALDTASRRAGTYELSFWGDNDLSVEQIAAMARLPHRYLRVSTVGRLRELDLEVFRTDPHPHLSIRFELPPSDIELTGLAGVFDKLIENPHPYDE